MGAARFTTRATASGVRQLRAGVDPVVYQYGIFDPDAAKGYDSN
jgi:hypothetical protein